MNTLSTVVGNPRPLVQRCLKQEELVELAQKATITIVLCTASFGLVLGSNRDLTQALMAGFKLPVMWFFSLIVCAPGFYAIAAALGQPIALRSLVALILSAAARASVVLLALLPILWVVSDVLSDSARGYHGITMLASAIYGLAGVAGLGVLLRSIKWSKSGVLVLGGWLTLFGIVSGQTAWSLRPFLGRPSESEVPFLRQPEGTFLQALSLGMDSARGRYRSRSAEAD